jgi:DNA (cytosine-5)-methyltransferase 1
MNHKEKLLELYNKAYSLKSDKFSLPNDIIDNINIIAQKSIAQKGVYTVLITLAVHKLLYPEQDIRYHQEKLPNGFSGRTIDTKFITPTLKSLNLPSMAESGWLTRSLEQPYPYTLDYHGHIRDIEAKKAFLFLVDKVQKSPDLIEKMISFLLYKIIEETKKNKIKIIKLNKPERLQIVDIIEMLNEHFFYDYHTFGGAKLPVIAFYAIYKSLLIDIKRYENCKLKELGYHTTCDSTSKSSGDIEIFSENNQLKEALEIKFQKEIDSNIVRIAKEKIIKFNPVRYYILSTEKVKATDKSEIIEIVNQIREQHGCQLILNGVIPSLKYYLRLISSLEKFLLDYSYLIENDAELKPIHKEIWNKILKNTENN